MRTPLDRAVALRRVAWFEALAAADVMRLAQLGEDVALAAGARLFSEGDAGDAVYVLVDGRLRVERAGAVLAELAPPECVGEMALLDRAPRSATVVAAADCELVRIDGDDFRDLLADAPEVLRGVLGVLVRRLRAARPR